MTIVKNVVKSDLWDDASIEAVAAKQSSAQNSTMLGPGRFCTKGMTFRLRVAL